MVGCWTGFVNIVARICGACLPIIDRVIDVGTGLLEEKLDAEPQKY